MFSTIRLRILSSYKYNPPLFKHITFIIDGHDPRINYINTDIKREKLLSYKFKKNGIRTQIVSDMNDMIIYTSKSDYCSDSSDGSMFLNMKLYNKLSRKDVLATDGGYTLFINQLIELSSEKGYDLSKNNFIYPIPFGAGVEYIDALLADYRLRHNIDVGMLNRFERVHDEHYDDPWISQHISNLVSKLNVPCSHSGPGIHAHSLHLNSSNELFGISPLAATLMESYNIAKSNSYQSPSYKQSSSLDIATLIILNRSTAQVTGAQYKYIAECQKAAYAIISTPEQLNSYFTKWKEIDNIKRRKNNNKEIIEKVSKGLNSSIRKRAVPPAQYPSPSKAPRTGIIAQTDSNSNSSAIATHRSNSPSLIRPASPSINIQQLAAFMFHQLMSQQLPSSILGIPLNTRHAEQSFPSGLPSLQPLALQTFTDSKSNSSNNNILNGIRKKNLKTCAICGSIEYS
ncbi:hypothetical protein INT45_013288 [Circinella minor]|uniref:Uncharacterized protein n=1 Tax=Circinella minor TaxID=1195481 RepID=A0A8H7S2Q3_9FUNG|nr:hypothetical protein INT45_013288 [Circinella minor]